MFPVLRYLKYGKKTKFLSGNNCKSMKVKIRGKMCITGNECYKEIFASCHYQTVEKKDEGENLENNQRKKTLSKGTMI